MPDPRQRHVYRPPKGSRLVRSILALAGGLLFAFLVFYLIPLMQKLEEMREEGPETLAEEITTEPPPEFEALEEPPPPEEEPEEPPELQPETQNIEIADLPVNLSPGIGGKVLLSVKPDFNVTDDPDAFGASDDLDQPPRPATRVDPKIPREVLRSGRGGRVLVRVMVDANGRVTEAKVKESSGNALLDRACVDAAKRWKFKPGIKQGRKAIMSALIPFNIKIKSAS